LDILGEVLAAEGAERAAHEVRDTEQSKADSLERLSAEYDYLAQIAAAGDLAGILEAQTPGRVAEFQQSRSWGATVAAWHRSASISRPSAQRLVVDVLASTNTARDSIAVLHSRLHRFMSQMPANQSDPLAETIHTYRPEVESMMNQVKERMQIREDRVTLEAMVQETEWKRNLLETLGPDVQPHDAARAIRSVAIFRDRWGIEDSPIPLGPAPDEYQWEQKSQRTSIQGFIDQLALHSPAHEQPNNWTEVPPSLETSLVNVGWQL
jgi:hypothetical protein